MHKNKTRPPLDRLALDRPSARTLLRGTAQIFACFFPLPSQISFLLPFLWVSFRGIVAAAQGYGLEPQERTKMGAGEGKKREILGPPHSGAPTLRAASFSGFEPLPSSFLHVSYFSFCVHFSFFVSVSFHFFIVSFFFIFVIQIVAGGQTQTPNLFLVWGGGRGRKITPLRRVRHFVRLCLFGPISKVN